MGIFTKHEKYNRETGHFEPVDKREIEEAEEYHSEQRRQLGEGVQGPVIPGRELTREEQMEPPRVHPWQTPRGKHFIKSVKTGVKKLDKKIVNYNRTSNIMRPGAKSYTPRHGTLMYKNYNPWGATFDTGMVPMRKPKIHKMSSAKYTVIGGKAYPIATSKSKKKKKSGKKKSSTGFDDFDMFDNYGYWK